MKYSYLADDPSDRAGFAEQLRASSPRDPELSDRVAAIIDDVRRRGDEAVLELTARYDATERAPETLGVPAEHLTGALDRVPASLVAALELAAHNIREIAEATLPGRVSRELPQGQTVEVVHSPVAAAGAYAPGGRAFYPSSVLMCCVTAAVAGVKRIALASPPAADGRVAAPTLAAARIGEASEVWGMGGAQAIAALALGTETIDPVDVIAGPGNAWVTEAKRQLAGTVGIDGIAGPSELVVICDETADPSSVALDVLAQAEHGPDTMLAVISPSEDVLRAVEAAASESEPDRKSVSAENIALIEAADIEAALGLSDALAPEHLELRFDGAGVDVARDRVAGAVFVGPGAATAFGDYAAGSNHVLPTAGAARFGGALAPATFLRRTSVVEISDAAAASLAPPVDEIARAEGLPVHGESALRAAGDDTGANDG